MEMTYREYLENPIVRGKLESILEKIDFIDANPKFFDKQERRNFVNEGLVIRYIYPLFIEMGLDTNLDFTFSLGRRVNNLHKESVPILKNFISNPGIDLEIAQIRSTYRTSLLKIIGEISKEVRIDIYHDIVYNYGFIFDSSEKNNPISSFILFTRTGKFRKKAI